MELKLRRFGVECEGLLLPGLLFADDPFRFGEDIERLEQSLMVLEEWCSRWGMIEGQCGKICHCSFQKEIMCVM